jgi:hypothetical protein
MNFERWLRDHGPCAQLTMEDGLYAVRYSPVKRTYTAAELVTRTDGPVVRIETAPSDAKVRATAQLGADGEYVHEPCWIPGRGLGAHRVAPVDACRETADQARGYAVAALRRASERSYDRLRSLSMDAADRQQSPSQWPAILVRLTFGPDLGPFREATLAALRALPLPELMVVRGACRCVVCSTRSLAGERRPVFELTRSLVICARCHGGHARAAA